MKVTIDCEYNIKLHDEGRLDNLTKEEIERSIKCIREDIDSYIKEAIENIGSFVSDRDSLLVDIERKELNIIAEE